MQGLEEPRPAPAGAPTLAVRSIAVEGTSHRRHSDVASFLTDISSGAATTPGRTEMGEIVGASPVATPSSAAELTMSPEEMPKATAASAGSAAVTQGFRGPTASRRCSSRATPTPATRNGDRGVPS